jgi:hypothetical protein
VHVFLDEVQSIGSECVLKYQDRFAFTVVVNGKEV